MGARTLWLRSQDSTIRFCQLCRRQHHGSEEERSAQMAERHHHPNLHLKGRVELLRETFDCLRQSKLSVNLPISEFCSSVVEGLGMIIDRFGIRPAPSKIEAITQLSQPSTVEEVRVPLGMAGYFRKFVPNYSSVLAPISDLLRDSRFHNKKDRRLKVPWGQVQTEAMETFVSLLTFPPILALPDWSKPFRLHTDAD